MMGAKERFALNPAAKEYRLQKMRRRLEAATPGTKRRPSAMRWAWIVGGVIVMAMIVKRLV